MIEEFLCLTKFILQKKERKKNHNFLTFQIYFYLIYCFFDFYPSIEFSKLFSVLFFAILKKDLWGGESSFEHWIWFWTLFNFGVIVQVNSPPTRWCQKSQKKKPKLSSQKQIWYSRPINYAFPKRSSQKIMEWILKDLLCFIRSFEIQLKSCHVSK